MFSSVNVSHNLLHDTMLSNFYKHLESKIQRLLLNDVLTSEESLEREVSWVGLVSAMASDIKSSNDPTFWLRCSTGVSANISSLFYNQNIVF